MWKNYVVIVYRNIIRQKLNSLVNVLGLAAGISAASLIFLFVNTEMSYDEQWSESNQLYRVNETFGYYQKPETPYAVVSYLLGTRLRELFSEQSVCRVEGGNYGKKIFVEDKWVNPGAIKHTDDNFFELFDYPRQKLDVDTDTLPAAWVADQVFDNYFEQYNATSFVYGENTYYVAGTFSKQGYHSHLDVDIVIPYDSTIVNNWSRENDWTRLVANVYVKSELPTAQLEEKINRELDTNVDSFVNRYDMQMELYFPVIAVPDIHFSKQFQFDSYSNGDPNVVWLFAIIGLLILIVAGINYINMAIAQGGIRAREIAIRKAMGASRKNIIVQFLGESVAITLIAIVLSFIMTEMLFPAFNSITGFEFYIYDSYVFWPLLLFLFFVWFLLGFFSGFYPAFVLSEFQPVTIFRSGADLLLYRNVRSYFISSTKVRKAMLVVQYVIAGTIIITTIIIQVQTHFLFQRDLGFDLEKLVVIELEGNSAHEPEYKSLLSAVNELENVNRASLANKVPGQRTGRLLFTFHFNDSISQGTYDFYSGSYDVINVLGAEIIAGRGFDRTGTEEQIGREVLVNEKFVEHMGWDEPLGKKFRSGFQPAHTIVGVVRNFNYYSLHREIAPLVILPDIFSSHFLVINTDHPNTLIQSGKLEHLWNGFFPSEVPSIYKLSESYNAQYTKETRLLSIFMYFSGLSLIISGLGLFALSAFSVQRRSKEISIRKILGADRKHIIKLLYVDYIQIFLFSTLIAWGVAWLFAERWLGTFVASVSPGILPYIIGSLVIFLVAIITVSYHTLKAFVRNPSVYLKYE
jgi:putative ABC transport system permease protein